MRRESNPWQPESQSGLRTNAKRTPYEATLTGFEPVLAGSTIQCINQLCYRAVVVREGVEPSDTRS